MKYGILTQFIAFATIVLFVSAIAPNKITIVDRIVTVEKTVKDSCILATKPNGSPLKNIKIMSQFGYRQHPIFKRVKMHTGLDIYSKIGTQVYSTSVGYICETGYKADGYGKYVVIQSGEYKMFYCHLSKVTVNLNDKVYINDVVGYTGNTGASTGPHLHYEIRINDKPVNPLPMMVMNE